MSSPPLQTARLRLEPWRLADVPALHRIWTDPDVRRELWDGAILSRRRVEQVVGRALSAAADPALGFWMVRLPDTHAAIGVVALMRREGIEGVELLYALGPAWWGRGFATEAAGAVVARAFAHGVPCVTAATAPSNTPSRAVLARLGLREVRRGTLEGRDAVFYALERDRDRKKGSDPFFVSAAVEKGV